MKKHYLIMLAWGMPLLAAEQTSTDAMPQKAGSISVPSSFIMKEDGNGDLSAGILITADLQGNATTATHAVYAEQALTSDTARTFIEPLAGDVTGNQTNTVVVTVGGQSAEQIATAVQKVYAATAAQVPGTLLMRDEQGNCAANIITADLQGNAATATYATHAGQVDRALRAEQAECSACAEKAIQADKALLADQATHALQSDKALHADYALQADQTKQADTAVRASEADHALSADLATQTQTFTEPLMGDVVGDQKRTIVTTVGGQPAATIAAAVQTIQQASSDYSGSTLVSRDAQGDFCARNIKATLLGHATTATHAHTFNKALEGDVIGKQGATVVSRVGGQLATEVATATHAVQLATASLASNRLIMRDEHGDFAAHVITADVHGNAATATQATRALQADHAMYAEKADQAVQAEKALNADTATQALQSDKAAHADQAFQASHAVHALEADHAWSADKVVQADFALRSSQADFATSAVHADKALHADQATYTDRAATADKAIIADQAISALQSDASLRSAQADCAACARIFTEPLGGDVTGNQNSTVVATVGGYSAAEIAAAVQKIQTTTPSSESKPITVTTDGGNAIPKAGILAIRGGHNIKVRASDSSVVISLAQSPSVTGSLTAGTTITAGTGLQVVSGGAAITGDTKINIAGPGSTTIGNPASTTIYNGPLCLKAVNQGSGVPLGIDTEGNVVALSFDVYKKCVDSINQNKSPFALSLTKDSNGTPKLYALVRTLIAIISEQQKRIERVESLVF